MNAIKMKDMKAKLSVLWLFTMLNYMYGDIVSLMDADFLKQYLTGTINGVHLTQGFLLASSVFMEIPIVMILLSLQLRYKANRWANIIAGALMTVSLTMTLFVTVPSMHYAFFTVIEIATTAFIVRCAWIWRETEVRPENAA